LAYAPHIGVATVRLFEGDKVAARQAIIAVIRQVFEGSRHRVASGGKPGLRLSGTAAERVLASDAKRLSEECRWDMKPRTKTSILANPNALPSSSATRH
jgi:hypothetical protein